jgi:hypothetical protein
MRKSVLFLIFILAVLLPSSVHAQSPLVLKSLQIGIWPEFDRPSVLVIYRVTLSNTTTLPASVSLRIPINAGEPNAVAARQVDGSLFNIDYTRQVTGQWAIINFSATTADFQIEYYDPGLTINGNSRHFSYSWPGDYGVTQLSIQVQQPYGATNMQISPSLGAGAVGSDTLTYYTQDIGTVTAGQNFQISLDYQKSSDVLSAENLPVTPSAQIPQTSTADLNLKSWLPWVLGIVGAGLIVGGVIWFWQSGRQNSAPKARRPRSRSRVLQSEINTGETEAPIYCSQCGKRAQPGDQFCRSCGSPIRTK